MGEYGIFVRNIDLQSAEIALVRGIIGVGFLLIVTFFLKGHISKQRLADNKILLIISGIALSANWIFLFEAYKNTMIAQLAVAAAVLFLYVALTTKDIEMAAQVIGVVLILGATFISEVFGNNYTQ